MKYKETDEIEITLRSRGTYTTYDVVWRYKKPKWKFLWFKVRDKWKTIQYYLPGIFIPSEDPDRWTVWFSRGFDLGRESDVQEYEHLVKTVKTKKDLYDYFHVKDNIDLYYRHLEQHREWLEKTNNTIKRLVK